MELGGKGNWYHFATAMFHHGIYLFALAEVFTLQLSSDHSLEVLPFVNDPPLHTVMKTGDYLHFPKVSKLMRPVQVSFQSLGGGMSTRGWLAECDFS